MSNIRETNLWDPNKIELVFAEHPRFSDTGKSDPKVHAGAAVAMWNGTLKCGLRDLDNDKILDQFNPWTKRWENPNIVIVPVVNGCTELHVLLASLCPDVVLKRHKLDRYIANCALWPISIPPDQCESFASRVEDAFADTAWGQLIGWAQRTDLEDKSSIRLLSDDNKFWMREAFRVTAELAPNIPSSPKFTPRDLYQSMAREIWMMSQARKIRIRKSKVIAEHRDGSVVRTPLGSLDIPGMGDIRPPKDGVEWSDRLEREMNEQSNKKQIIWDPWNDGQRRDVLQSVFQTPNSMHIKTIAGLLRKEMLPEDLPDNRHSEFKEDIERHFYDKRKKCKIRFGQIEDKAMAYDSCPVSIDQQYILRDFSVLLDPIENEIVVLLSESWTQQEIADKIGGYSRTTISRKIAKIQEKLSPYFGLPKSGHAPL